MMLIGTWINDIGSHKQKSLMNKLNYTYKQIAEIVFTLNLIESTIKNIIVVYINPEKDYFFREFFLHNSYVSIGTKAKIIDLICIRVSFKNVFKENLYRLIEIRNAVAHSDNLVSIQDFVSIQQSQDNFEQIYNSIQLDDSPKISGKPERKLKQITLNHLYNEFSKKATLVLDNLRDLRDKIDEHKYK
jgi:hypothetical protein